MIYYYYYVRLYVCVCIFFARLFTAGGALPGLPYSTVPGIVVVYLAIALVVYIDGTNTNTGSSLPVTSRRLP